MIKKIIQLIEHSDEFGKRSFALRDRLKPGNIFDKNILRQIRFDESMEFTQQTPSPIVHRSWCDFALKTVGMERTLQKGEGVHIAA